MSYEMSEINKNRAEATLHGWLMILKQICAPTKAQYAHANERTTTKNHLLQQKRRKAHLSLLQKNAYAFGGASGMAYRDAAEHILRQFLCGCPPEQSGKDPPADAILLPPRRIPRQP